MSKNSTPTADYNRKFVSPASIVIDLVLTAIFFVLMQHYVIYDHTPDWSERARQIASAYTTLSLSGVFWLVLQGFRVTLVDQHRRKKAGIES